MDALSPRAEDIVRSAKAHLLAGGYNGFSYADISSDVGIRKASIHHYFPTKADLVLLVVVRYRQEILESMARLDRELGGPRERLSAYIRFWEDCIGARTMPLCLCLMLAAELPALPGEIAREIAGHFQALQTWVVSLLDDGQTSGDFQLAGTPQEAGQALVATVHGAMLSARALEDPAMFGRIVRPQLASLAQPA
jgi:TetR/AcrR family transcriptional repressor of nem operon